MDIEPTPNQKKKKGGTSSKADASFIDYNAAQPGTESKEDAFMESKKALLESIGPLDQEADMPQKRTILYRLFSPETSMGRFMRPVLRKTASYLAAFVIGLYCAYFLLFLPAAKEMEKLKAEFVTINQDLQTTQGKLDDLQKRFDQTSVDLDNANRRASYMQLLSNVSRARLALAEKDGPAALVVLKDVEKNLKTLNPAIVKVDANMAQLLNSRLELVITELNRDPLTAISDLEKLYSALLELENALLK